MSMHLSSRGSEQLGEWGVIVAALEKGCNRSHRHPLEAIFYQNMTHAPSAHKAAHDLAEAERMLQEGLKAAGLRKADLECARAGADVRKLALAEKIWSRTTAPQGWIAEKLAMRRAANVSQLLRRRKQDEPLRQSVPAALGQFLSKNDA